MPSRLDKIMGDDTDAERAPLARKAKAVERKALLELVTVAPDRFSAQPVFDQPVLGQFFGVAARSPRSLSCR
jgi:hypothetical protein